MCLLGRMSTPLLSIYTGEAKILVWPLRLRACPGPTPVQERCFRFCRKERDRIDQEDWRSTCLS
jgi:hypothetical protein